MVPFPFPSILGSVLLGLGFIVISLSSLREVWASYPEVTPELANPALLEPCRTGFPFTMFFPTSMTFLGGLGRVLLIYTIDVKSQVFVVAFFV